jgi:hypothetical protein
MEPFHAVHGSEVLILLKNLCSSFESLRTNGEEVEIIGGFPFMLSLVEAFLGFSRIRFLKHVLGGNNEPLECRRRLWLSQNT